MDAPLADVQTIIVVVYTTIIVILPTKYAFGKKAWNYHTRLSGSLVSAKLERERGELSMLKINSRLPHSRGTLDMSSSDYYLEYVLVVTQK